MEMLDQSVVGAAKSIADRWRPEQAERQARRNLDRADFAALGEGRLWATVVPTDMGGLWCDAQTSLRPVCDALRLIAAADSSVALVAAMHPSVIAFWLANPSPEDDDWTTQRDAVLASAAAGEQWGTVTSEPGSGGDLSRTRAVATPDDGARRLPGRPYKVSGDKHFGSGLGVSRWMVTTAIPEGETEPAIFVLDVLAANGGLIDGVHITAEWDGVGMAATQSHAVRLDGAPAVRFGRDEPLDALMRAPMPWVLILFTSVTLGVVDAAISRSRERLAAKLDELRAFERVEWAAAEQDHWVAVQAFEGALRAIEAGDPAVAAHAALRAKEAVAGLAEDVLRRLCRVHGGGSFSRSSPFAHWFEDVRALGFLRPPWALAYDRLFDTSFLPQD